MRELKDEVAIAIKYLILLAKQLLNLTLTAILFVTDSLLLKLIISFYLPPI